MAISGPTGIPRKKTIPMIDPMTKPTMMDGSVRSKSSPFPFIQVAIAPPASAIIPITVVKSGVMSRHDIFSLANGTSTEIVKNKRPSSSPRRSTTGNRRSSAVSFKTSRMLVAVAIIGDRPIKPMTIKMTSMISPDTIGIKTPVHVPSLLSLYETRWGSIRFSRTIGTRR